MSVKFCGECGCRIDLDASYCSECGWKVIDDFDEEIADEIYSQDGDDEKRISSSMENGENMQSQIPPIGVGQTANEQIFKAQNYNQANYNNQHNYQNNSQYNQQGYNYQYETQNQFNQFSNQFSGNYMSPKSRKSPIILSCLILAGILIIGISAIFLFGGSEDSKNIALTEKGNGLLKEDTINTPSREKVENIVKDATFDTLQGEWSGTCTLIELKNIENSDDISPEYIQIFKDLLNVDSPCILEVDGGDLKLEIDVGEGMNLEFEDCSLNEGVITFEKSEERNGITRALQTKAYVQDDEGQLTINGTFKINAGKAELIYKYTVKR